MLRFFRKIRQKLLSDGNTGKYFKYALGEILLVMIGILLALQVNNWNEERKDRSKEINYLQGIKADFNTDIQNMSLVINRFDELSEKFSLLDSLFRNDQINSTTINELGPPMQLVIPPVEFRNNSGFYTSMVSEGKSELISNTTLLNRIQNVYNIDYNRLSDIADRINQQADMIRWELRDDRYHQEDMFQNSTNVIDILSAMGLRNHYANVLKQNRDNVLEIIQLIDAELEVLKS